MIEEHKLNKVEEPLAISRDTVRRVLEECGVEEDRVSGFASEYDARFGLDTALNPRNIVDKQLEVKTPDVTIRVSPERSDLIETRIIDGAQYILVRAEEGVEVNGVPVHIS